VISVDQEGMTPQVRLSVSHYLNQADQFSLICRQVGVARRKLTAEEGDCSFAIVKNGTNAYP
jgi:hypothetical protein